MKGKAGCTHCGGSGFVLDPDPRVPARACSCVHALEADAEQMGIPSRYRQASFETFWEWWKGQHPKAGILGQVKRAEDLLGLPEELGGPGEDLRRMLEHILHKGSSQNSLRPAQEPSGYANLKVWATQGRPPSELWWIDGLRSAAGLVSPGREGGALRLCPHPQPGTEGHLLRCAQLPEPGLPQRAGPHRALDGRALPGAG